MFEILTKLSLTASLVLNNRAQIFCVMFYIYIYIFQQSQINTDQQVIGNLQQELLNYKVRN